MKRHVHSVGVDVGGTWIRVHAVDELGRRLKQIKSPAPKVKTLPQFLARLWRRWKIQNPKFLIVGSRGVWLLKERKALERSLEALAQRVRVISDVEISFESALTPLRGTPGRASGILLLAGTGSIAVGRDGRGRVARAGGLGPVKGDEGSSYWIGREYARRAMSNRFKVDSVAKTASLAKTVLKRARRDAVCRQIRREAQRHLADLALRLARKLNFHGRIPISWAGSLLSVGNFRRGVFQFLRRDKTFKFKLIVPKAEAAEAAAVWAGKLQGFPASFLTTR